MTGAPSENFQSLRLSAEDLRQLNPKWSDVMIDDYLSRSSDLDIVSDSIDSAAGESAAISAALLAHIEDKDNPHEVDSGDLGSLAIDGGNSMLSAINTDDGRVISHVPSTTAGVAFAFTSAGAWGASDYKLFNFDDRFHIRTTAGVDEAWFADKIISENGLFESNEIAANDGFTLNQPAGIHTGGALLALDDAFGNILKIGRPASFGAIIENPSTFGKSSIEFKIGTDEYFQFTSLSDVVTLTPRSTSTKTGLNTTQTVWDFEIGGVSALQVSLADFRSESNSDLGTFLFPFNDIYFNGVFFSEIGSGAASIAFHHKTLFDYVAVGAKLFAYSNLAVEKMSLELTAVNIWTLNVAGGISFSGAFSSNVTDVIATPHVAADEMFIHVDDDTIGSTATVDLPAAAISAGRVYHIKKMGTTANVIIDGSGAETVDGGLTATLTTQYESIMIVCDGTSWSIH